MRKLENPAVPSKTKPSVLFSENILLSWSIPEQQATTTKKFEQKKFDIFGIFYLSYWFSRNGCDIFEINQPWTSSAKYKLQRQRLDIDSFLS